MIEFVIVLSLICIIYLFTKSKNKKNSDNIKPFSGSSTGNEQTSTEPKKSVIQHKKHSYLCSKAENNFYQVLLEILPSNYIVHCQVSMMAIVQPVNFKDNSKTWAKRLDFVITDRDTQIFAVIELDDSSHRQKKRQERDLYVNSAFEGHHKLLRFEALARYNPLEIASIIERETDIKCNISALVPQYG
ncbi:DUF2726 domain-containing protein [Vibrio parahaemolyticus]|uniref:DUF2726 domain-containing protein n=1 Tax=Vibrio parahaemolyticus TaxID=670 RepID=UPI000472C277|nr:DUF2726 domain-containing protein [Vibrio parahaemolyticus]HCE4764142.1 DUF2726 domain-containing protein [Vibrio parahaemolyticus]HCG8345658.1 DUF2726 domain-containing protein [Vibrio parahaemolyticus]HCH1654212.1 DUF2726 domain-containing protein [Vibrio parahaemolyticus]HCH3203293.1 DUF2726 domain-containing protein [Vibrio parahaemolyticus]HCH3915669.1 DUF2726 domain-containing protein [Vibrio parahaemolyticus]